MSNRPINLAVQNAAEYNSSLGGHKEFTLSFIPKVSASNDSAEYLHEKVKQPPKGVTNPFSDSKASSPHQSSQKQ